MFDLDGNSDDGLPFNIKTLDILLVRLLFPKKTLLISTESSGNNHFSDKTPEASMTVGDAKRNESLA